MPGKRKATSTTEPPKKRRKAAPAIEEITFDPHAREDYLTGFHKRKLQRAKHAREEAAKREREEKITARKLLREGRKADLEKHVAEVNTLLHQDIETEQSGSGKENRGRREGDQEPVNGVEEPSDADVEVEYPDDDRFTTVTVEAVEISRDGFHQTLDDEEEEEEVEGGDVMDRPSKIELVEGNDRKQNGRPLLSKAKSLVPKKKKKKFRYENKAERKMTRHKERSKNSIKAKDRKS